jgi:hypothetical protein
MSVQFDEKKTKQTIARMLEQIRVEADPLLLNRYRALFKREVSLFRRSWAAAYLLMLFDEGALGRAASPGRRKYAEGRFAGGEKGAGGERTFSGEALDEETSKRLFISIGRNRRLFPREILGLITAKTAAVREDIGSIRILDNYSFVQVRDAVAENIIAALNGYTFRGRTLAVSYARFRKDAGEDGREDAAPGSPAGDFPPEEAGPADREVSE